MVVRAIFVSIYLFLSFFLVIACKKLFDSKNKYASSLYNLTSVAFLAALFYTLFLMMPNHFVILGSIFLSLYYASMDGVVAFLMAYILFYSDTKKISIKMKIILCSILFSDMTSILLNTPLHHVFTFESAVYKPLNIEYLLPKHGVPMYIHLGICYVMIVVGIVVLIRKIIKSPMMYKGKYILVLLQVFAVVIVNAVCLAIDFPIDFSVLMYPFLCVGLCYFTIFSTPKRLVIKANSYVVDELNKPIFCFDIDDNCVHINKKARDTFGIIGDDRNSEIEQELLEWTRTFDKKSNDYLAMQRKHMVNGGEHFFESEYFAIRDKDNNYLGCFFSLDDRTEEVKRFMEEQYRANHDTLTGLLNREAFFEEGKKRIQENPETKRYMLTSNIKDFKFINEIFGMAKGDEILKKQAELLKRCSHENSVIGRITADKFAVLVEKEHYSEVNLLSNIGRMCALTRDSNFRMQIYVGVYEINDVNEPIELMLDKATMAINRIIGDYNKNISYYDERDIRQMTCERSILADFNKALECKEFCIYLQPIVDKTGKMCGAEAFARWNHPDKGIMYPVDFIEILEKTGLISRLDMYMWEMAAERLQKWAQNGLDKYFISVNISAKDFYQLDVYDVMVELTDKYHFDPKNLKLEITESVIMPDSLSQLAVIDKLRDYGFDVEIDDFGSGYSSLNTLKDINVDVIKLDMKFIHASSNEEKSKIIVSSVINMAKNLNLPTIIEGVETQKQFDEMVEIGCDMYQGFFFSKPLPVKTFEEDYFVQCFR